MIPGEIDRLAAIANAPCSVFQHLIVSRRILDPIEKIREGHLLTDEGSQGHQVFDLLIQYTGIRRKLDCEFGICYVVPASESEAFESIAQRIGVQIEWGQGALPKTILTYLPPVNLTWIVTYIELRSLPIVNDAQLTAIGTSSGNFESDDFEVTGLTDAWLSLNGNPILGTNLSSFAVFNKPILLTFAGGERVDVRVVRNPFDSLPSIQEIYTALHSYLAPPWVYDRLARERSVLEAA